MKKIILVIILFTATHDMAKAQSVGIGTATPNARAALDIQSNTKGLLIPRMTSAQRDSISPAPAGLLVFDNTTGSFWFKGNTNWVELVDTSKSGWRQNGNEVYARPNTNVGIRTTAPKFPIDIHTNDAMDGFAMRLRNPNITAGTKTTILLSSSYLSFFNGAAPAVGITALAGENNSQHLLFSTSSYVHIPVERMRIDSSGNVGIGLTRPETKLHISGGTDITLGGGGYFLLGNSGGSNIVIDDNEIQQRINGAASKLYLQNGGGGLQLGTGTGTFNFGTTGELSRNGITGTADILPIAYGKVLFDGTKLGGTNNFTVSKTSVGNYVITLPNEVNVYLNQDNYSIIATPFKKQNYSGESFAANILTTINSNNTITVYVREFDVNYVNYSCNCYNETASFTYITGAPNYAPTDASFSFIIYKL
ncbi:MAG: hypothetical protein V4722_25540 [Bacteroidota bacterium]